MQILLNVFAVVTVLVLRAGCAVEVGTLGTDLSTPSVSFEAPTAWPCDQTVKLPTTPGMAKCTVGRNATQDVQAVTVHQERQGVASGQSVYCRPLTVVGEGHAHSTTSSLGMMRRSFALAQTRSVGQRGTETGERSRPCVDPVYLGGSLAR
jgi:hypothetical protein